MSYKDLEVWQLARELTIEIHKMSLEQLPKHEKYEVGSQIRRSIKSVKASIVEGYGRRQYKQDFLRFFNFALASNLETVDHLETLFETGSLENQDIYDNLHERLDTLGKKLNAFTKAVKSGHISEK